VAAFVDEAQIHAKGGDGGAGAVSFRREAHVARGGPDGGDGGRGGDVWLVADRNVASLYGFRDHPHRRAESGTHGMGKGRHGRSGADLDVSVPVGTLVRAGSEVLADLAVEGARWLAARGGRGGRGNARFLTNRRRAPTFAEQGEVGEERWLDLELKLMADVALVGLPNAGKSTLISRISAAKPKIADYPFTTLEPHLGVVRFGEHELVVADIPGLIEGASEGRGLGDRFLRHVERCRAVVLLLDLSPDAPAAPQEQERVLVDEMARYDRDLAARPRLVVGSKADNEDRSWGWKGQRISSLTGEGLPELLGWMAKVVEEARASLPAPARYVLHRPEPVGVQVERTSGGVWVVRGRSAERAVALSDLTDPSALAYAQSRLRRLGVDRYLARAGARAGDRVRIGDFEFEYQPDLVAP
jgi:GTP-binding protein